MPVDSATYNELTQPFRWVDNVDNGNLTLFPLARAAEAVTPFSNIAGVRVIADERFNLLTNLRRRFLLTIEGADYVRPSDFAGFAPGGLLVSSRWGLSAGRRVVITKFETDYAENVTRLLVWG